VTIKNEDHYFQRTLNGYIFTSFSLPLQAEVSGLKPSTQRCSGECSTTVLLLEAKNNENTFYNFIFNLTLNRCNLLPFYLSLYQQKWLDSNPLLEDAEWNVLPYVLLLVAKKDKTLFKIIFQSNFE
jgi:hypothetical protein